MLNVCIHNNCELMDSWLTFVSVGNQWQSLGLCKDKCVLYAFGVVKGFECWCSDYAPNPSKARTDCVTCPQFDLEKCGNSKTGTYGYIDTGTRPKGTAVDASDVPSSTTTSSTLTVSDPSTSTPSSRETTTPSSTKASTMFLVSSIAKATTVFTPNVRPSLSLGTFYFGARHRRCL